MSPDRVAGPKTKGWASAPFPCLAGETLGDTQTCSDLLGIRDLLLTRGTEQRCIPYVPAIHTAFSNGPFGPMWAEIHQIWFLTPQTHTQKCSDFFGGSGTCF